MPLKKRQSAGWRTERDGTRPSATHRYVLTWELRRKSATRGGEVLRAERFLKMKLPTTVRRVSCAEASILACGRKRLGAVRLDALTEIGLS